MLTINVAVLLAVIVVLRLSRRPRPRSPFDEKLGVVLVLVLGLLLAPTSFGQAVLDLVGELVHGISQSGL